jgi:hypothetical protein
MLKKRMLFYCSLAADQKPDVFYVIIFEWETLKNQRRVRCTHEIASNAEMVRTTHPFNYLSKYDLSAG